MFLFPLIVSTALSGPEFKPSGPWAAGIEEGRCIISRSYVADSRQGILEFGLFPLGSAFVRTILPPDIDTGVDGENNALLLTLNGVSSTLTQSPVQSGISADGRQVRWLSGFKRADLEPLADAPEILITLGPKDPIRFSSSDAAQALAALDNCVAKQVTDWGIDLPTEASIKDGAVATNYGTWITLADYPPAAKQMKLQGAVNVVYFMEADGGVRDCRVISSSGHKILDEAACNAIKLRARFKPARNAEGHPVRQMGSRRVIWSLPR